MSKYLLKSGYFNADYVMENCPEPFIFVIGGRGTGKTYGVTKWCCNNCDKDHKFIYMRRTDKEIKFINASGSIYKEHTPNIKLQKGDIYTVFKDEEPIGYHIALSTIHNIRGFSFNDVDYIIFDEFIAEKGTVTRKWGGEQMLNAYETINRNRELEGKPPVKVIFLSNFNTVQSDIMEVFGFTDEIYKLYNEKPLGIYNDNLKRLIMINDSPISEKKKNTVLYQVNKSKIFEEMAIKNNGVEHIIEIGHYPNKAYQVIGRLGDIRVNQLYSGMFYLTKNRRDDNHSNSPSKSDIIKYNFLKIQFLFDNIIVDCDETANKFLLYFDLLDKT